MPSSFFTSIGNEGTGFCCLVLLGFGAFADLRSMWVGFSLMGGGYGIGGPAAASVWHWVVAIRPAAVFRPRPPGSRVLLGSLVSVLRLVWCLPKPPGWELKEGRRAIVSLRVGPKGIVDIVEAIKSVTAPPTTQPRQVVLLTSLERTMTPCLAAAPPSFTSKVSRSPFLKVWGCLGMPGGSLALFSVLICLCSLCAGLVLVPGELVAVALQWRLPNTC